MTEIDFNELIKAPFGVLLWDRESPGLWETCSSGISQHGPALHASGACKERLGEDVEINGKNFERFCFAKELPPSAYAVLALLMRRIDCLTIQG